MSNSWRHYLAKAGRSWIFRWENRHRQFITKHFRLWCEDSEVLCHTNRNFVIYASPHDYISHRIFFFHEYNSRLSDLIQYSLRPGYVCWDLGAERGWFSLLMASIVGSHGRVDAFEAYQPTHQKLVKNINENHFHWVSAHNVGVGDKQGDFFFVPPHTDETKHISGGHKDCGGIGFVSKIQTPSSIQIPIIKLDDFANEQSLSRLDFIKADIEGSELSAFMGAKYTIQTYKPALLVEYNEPALQANNATVADLDLFLRSLDYQIFSATSMQVIDRNRIIVDPEQQDVLCIHQSKL